jgi:hypothetical protein
MPLGWPSRAGRLERGGTVHQSLNTFTYLAQSLWRVGHQHPTKEGGDLIDFWPVAVAATRFVFYFSIYFHCPSCC